jgi:hypothetical protein
MAGMQHRGQLNTMYTACSSHASLRGGAIKRWDPFDGVRGRNQSSCDLPCKKICSFGETVDSFGWTQLGTTDQWPYSMWVPMASHCSWPKGTLIADKKKPCIGRCGKRASRHFYLSYSPLYIAGHWDHPM